MAIGDGPIREQNPNPILNMGVEIHREWTEDFWKLAEVLGMGHKETVNWVVDAYFKNTKIKSRERSAKAAKLIADHNAARQRDLAVEALREWMRHCEHEACDCNWCIDFAETTAIDAIAKPGGD